MRESNESFDVTQASHTEGEETPFVLNEPTKITLITVGVVAAVVSAATVAYIFWRRSQHLPPQVESVQQLLDRYHEQVRHLQDRLDELSSPA
jgi:hypothetical protein